MVDDQQGDKGLLEFVSDAHDLMELAEFMEDEHFTEALDLIVKLVVKPHIPSSKAATLAVQMQAFSAKFKMQATALMVLKNSKAGTRENKLKNTYFAMSEVCDKLAAALKYIARDGF